MSRSKKIVSGALMLTAALAVRTIVRVVRARRQRAPEPAIDPAGRGTGVVSSAPGAHFPEGGPQPLQTEEGAPI